MAKGTANRPFGLLSQAATLKYILQNQQNILQQYFYHIFILTVTAN